MKKKKVSKKVMQEVSKPITQTYCKYIKGRKVVLRAASLEEATQQFIKLLNK